MLAFASPRFTLNYAHTGWKKTCFPRAQIFAQVPRIAKLVVQLHQFNPITRCHDQFIFSPSIEAI
jgi:hypothetical protein